MKQIIKNAGQSLMETIVAIAVMLAVVVAVLALVTSSVVGQKESEFQITAVNLAREGIEVVRGIRDSNWLAGAPWDQGLTGGTKAIVDFDPESNQWQVVFNPTVQATTLYLSPEKVFFHDQTGDCQFHF